MFIEIAPEIRKSGAGTTVRRRKIGVAPAHSKIQITRQVSDLNSIFLVLEPMTSDVHLKKMLILSTVVCNLSALTEITEWIRRSLFFAILSTAV